MQRTALRAAADAERYIASSESGMNFEKYSKSEFESFALDAAATRRLADQLQDEVVQEIHEAVSTAFLSVVEALNGQGHNLKL